MRVVSLNCNGIRSAARKGLFEWVAQHRIRVLCLQETKAQPGDLEHDPAFAPSGWWVYQNHAQRKGYAGVTVYSRLEPDSIIDRLGAAEFDDEGRYLYLPSGSAGPERQASKFRFLEFFLPKLAEMRADGREYILCGDWNIAHTKKDLKNWRSNQKNSGFLPEERAWMDKILAELGWVDVYRSLYPDAEGDGYTWWSNRGNAWANNVGWRIDYQIATPGVAAAARTASVFKEQRFSDHAPLTVDYDL
jgi:exodeoxyribonuclease-3